MHIVSFYSHFYLILVLHFAVLYDQTPKSVFPRITDGFSKLRSLSLGRRTTSIKFRITAFSSNTVVDVKKCFGKHISEMVSNHYINCNFSREVDPELLGLLRSFQSPYIEIELGRHTSLDSVWYLF